MNRFRVIAIPTKVADLVRTTSKAPGYGHPAHTETATGHGPCRHCLRTFRIGEERRTLFTYDPFYGMEQIPLPGPIFIHADGCERYSSEGGYPPTLIPHAAVICGYQRGRRLLLEVEAAAGEQSKVIQDVLQRADVDYIHVRDREAGCFDFRVERLG